MTSDTLPNLPDRSSLPVSQDITHLYLHAQKELGHSGSQPAYLHAGPRSLCHLFLLSEFLEDHLTDHRTMKEPNLDDLKTSISETAGGLIGGEIDGIVRNLLHDVLLPKATHTILDLPDLQANPTSRRAKLSVIYELLQSGCFSTTPAPLTSAHYNKLAAYIDKLPTTPWWQKKLSDLLGIPLASKTLHEPLRSILTVLSPSMQAESPGTPSPDIAANHTHPPTLELLSKTAAQDPEVAKVLQLIHNHQQLNKRHSADILQPLHIVVALCKADKLSWRYTTPWSIPEHYPKALALVLETQLLEYELLTKEQLSHLQNQVPYDISMTRARHQLLDYLPPLYDLPPPLNKTDQGGDPKPPGGSNDLPNSTPSLNNPNPTSSQESDHHAGVRQAPTSPDASAHDDRTADLPTNMPGFLEPPPRPRNKSTSSARNPFSQDTTNSLAGSHGSVGNLDDFKTPEQQPLSGTPFPERAITPDQSDDRDTIKSEAASISARSSSSGSPRHQLSPR